MEVEARMKVHNRFDVVVRDAETGGILEEAFAENVVLNAYYDRSPFGELLGVKLLVLGSGAGTPAVTDTGLFAEWDWGRALSLIEVQRAVPLSMMRFRNTLATSDAVGRTITELGLRMQVSPSHASSYFLATHAMLQDSEGNPISIGPKTDTQIIDIYVTVYVEANPALAAGFTLEGSNFFNGRPYTTTGLSLAVQVGGSAVTSSPGSTAFNVATRTASTSSARVNNTAGNGFSVPSTTDPALPYVIADILGLRLPTVGAMMTLPNESVFPEYTFASKQIGVGDGVNKFFNFESAFFEVGSSVVTVDDVAQTLGVDYIECPQGARHCLTFTDFLYPGASGLVEVTDSLGAQRNNSIFSSGPDYSNWQAGRAWVEADFKREVQIRLVQGYVTDAKGGTPTVQISDDGIAWTTPTAVGTDTPTYWDAGFPSRRYDPPIKCRYLRVTKTSPIVYLHSLRAFGWGSIEFTNPPAASAVVKASWRTKFPPKSVNFLYDFSVALKTLRDV